MWSKNKARPTAAEARHIERIKAMPCGVCGHPAPSVAHEPEQGLWFAAIPLCEDCHVGEHNGWHRRKAIWNVLKLDEMKVLAATVEKLMEQR